MGRVQTFCGGILWLLGVGVLLGGCANTPLYDEPVRRVILTHPVVQHSDPVPVSPERTMRFEEPQILDRQDMPSRFSVSPPLAQLTVTSPFGERRRLGIESGGGTRLHEGVDLRAKVGTPVKAPRDGLVESVVTAGGYGLMIELDHGNGWMSVFAHLRRIRVIRGQRVTRGETIASTG
jgi:murein DD-endopeptidase MepM/ murein hydrolase activator NlpD